ncbi:MAG: indolepyruvate ferredoxin oxidoreductase subunit alpha, partial [Clostridia bacterium]|nr:indolepyruvate ferredoxin oxidoreductase subunit alpha [Clostridia bacterium]
MSQLMLGNAAVALGLRDAGCRLVSSYPGTPSTEITENAVKYEEIYCEWAPNEKVALETAAGAALAGARAFCAQKHVGLNVAADPLYTMSYIGVNGGLVIAVADDPGMHSSQNEQDSRHHAEASKVLMLEPSNSQECYDFTKVAFRLSEFFDTPVLLRLTTRVAHSTSLVNAQSDGDIPLKDYVKNPQKNVMMPAMAKIRHEFVEQRFDSEIEWAETCALNTVEMNSTSIGVIAAGITYE